jgi:hypothetical protein
MVSREQTTNTTEKEKKEYTIALTVPAIVISSTWSEVNEPTGDNQSSMEKLRVVEQLEQRDLPVRLLMRLRLLPVPVDTAVVADTGAEQCQQHHPCLVLLELLDPTIILLVARHQRHGEKKMDQSSTCQWAGRP